MVAIEYSRNFVFKIAAKASAALLVFIGFFALLFTTTPKPLGMPFTASGDSTILGGGVNVAHADAPACSCGDSGGGDSGGDSGGACGDSGDSCCGCGGCGCDGGDCGDSY